MPNPFSIFGEWWLWSFAGFVFTGSAFYFREGLSLPGSRRRLDKWMSERRAPARYRAIVSAILARLDARLAPEASNEGLSLTHWRRAWSWRTYDLTLLLAIAYPLLSLVIIWAVTDASGQLGNLIVLPGDAEISKKLAVLFGLVTILAFSRGSRVARKRGSEFYRYLSLTLAVAAALLTSIVVSTVSPTGYLVSVATMLALAVALLAAAARAIALRALGPAFRPIAGLGAVGLNVFSYAAAVTIFFDGTILWPQLLVLTVVLFGSFFLFEFACNSGRHALAYSFYTTMVYVFLVAAVASVATLTAASASTVLFLGFLPLVNAVFDYISIGLTRWCLQRGLRQSGIGTLLWSAIDAVTALLLFGLLGMGMILAVIFVKSGDGQPLIDINAVFASIHADPNGYWWLYASFFSTLLPTVLHLSVASWSFVTLAPNRLQDWVRVMIRKSSTDGLARAVAILSLAALVTVSVALPFFSMYVLAVAIWRWYPSIGTAYLWIFESFLGLMIR